MEKKTKKKVNILAIVSGLEKKHKIITYSSLLFLTVSTYFVRTENQKIKVDFNNLKEINKGLENNMVIFNRSFENFPMPVWQKVKRGDRFIMTYFNPEYIKRIGHLFKYDQYEQIGKDNIENFGEKFGKRYNKNDIEVAEKGVEIETIEETVGKNNKPMFVKNIKWRVIDDNNDTLVYGMIKKFLTKKEVESFKLNKKTKLILK